VLENSRLHQRIIHSVPSLMDCWSDSQRTSRPCLSGSLRNLSATTGRLGRPPLPASRPSAAMRLIPLGDLEPAMPSAQRLDGPGLRLLSSVRPHSPGHLGVMRDIRRSLPSLGRDSYLEAEPGQLPWERMAELAASASASAEPATPKRSHKDIRSRHRRSSGFNQSLPRAQSVAHCGSQLSKETAASRASDENTLLACHGTTHLEDRLAQRRPLRCDSLPPTGTVKSDSEATAQAKARAVAVLQRLFMEEMAKGGQDPNAAAAKALLRLSETPRQQPSEPDCVSPPAEPAKVLLQPPPEIEVPAEAPEPTSEAAPESTARETLSQQVAALAARPVVPRRPALDDGRRRPRPASRVAVRS